MNHNFKPGDLALLIKTHPAVPAGFVVSLTRQIPKGERLQDQDGSFFDAPRAVWEFQHPLIPKGHAGVTAEKNLMPLRGDFAPEREKSQEVPA